SAPLCAALAVVGQGLAEVLVDARQHLVLEHTFVDGTEALAGLPALPGLPQAAGVLVAGAVAQTGHVLEQQPRLSQGAVSVAHVLLAGLVLAGAVLHQPEQRPGRAGTLVAALILQGTLALGLALRLSAASRLAVLPALQQGVRQRQAAQQALAPLV